VYYQYPEFVEHRGIWSIWGSIWTGKGGKSPWVDEMIDETIPGFLLASSSDGLANDIDSCLTDFGGQILTCRSGTSYMQRQTQAPHPPEDFTFSTRPFTVRDLTAVTNYDL
jgi:hypothetical protein